MEVFLEVLMGAQKVEEMVSLLYGRLFLDLAAQWPRGSFLVLLSIPCSGYVSGRKDGKLWMVPTDQSTF